MDLLLQNRKIWVHPLDDYIKQGWNVYDFSMKSFSTLDSSDNISEMRRLYGFDNLDKLVQPTAIYQPKLMNLDLTQFVNDYLILNNDDLKANIIDEWTLSIVFKMNTFTANRPILGCWKSSTNDRNFMLYYFSSANQLVLYQSADGTSSSYTVVKTLASLTLDSLCVLTIHNQPEDLQFVVYLNDELPVKIAYTSLFNANANFTIGNMQAGPGTANMNVKLFIYSMASYDSTLHNKLMSDYGV